LKVAPSIAGPDLLDRATAGFGIGPGNAYRPHERTFAHDETAAPDGPEKLHERAAPSRTLER
jgi:hypothetical protein